MLVSFWLCLFIIKLYFGHDTFNHYHVKILNLFDPELQLINTRPIVKDKLEELLSDLKKIDVQ